ncbi:MAG: hypothetical protein NT029_00435 [Armatimonadetes bacterium]|nr:hypothetical protein [Armatimonadota bacterium]
MTWCIVLAGLTAGLASLAASAPSGAAEPPLGRVILLTERFEGSAEAVVPALRRALTAAGLQCRDTSAEGLAAALDAEGGPGVTLALPYSPAFPAPAREPLLRFLNRGNHLLALSGPPFQEMRVRVGGKWAGRAGLQAKLAEAAGTPVVRFDPAELKRWTRVTGTAGSEAVYLTEPGGPGGATAVHVRVAKLDTWDTLGSHALDAPFNGGRTLTTFWAKGGPKTPELLVEWKEADGTRWMSTVKLAPKWTRYAIRAEEMTFWPDGAARGRGGNGDRMNPERARQFTFGLANGLSHQEMGTAHEYWVADLQTAVDPVGAVDLNPPLLETLSPAYKTYPTRADTVLPAGRGRRLRAAWPVICAISRSPGLGLRPPAARFVPVLWAMDKAAGQRRGAAAHLLLNLDGSYRGSVWALLGVSQSALAAAGSPYPAVAAEMARRMARGLFLASAGAESFAGFVGEPVTVGARLVNLGSKPAQVTVVASVRGPDGLPRRTRQKVTVAAHTVQPMAVDLASVGSPEPGEYVAEVALRTDGSDVDRLAMPFRVLTQGRATEKNTVTASGGRFMLGGKPWFALGINYWPLYSAGQEPGEYWLHWLSPDQYDPAVVERDLAQMQRLGMNLVSIQYGRLDQARPLAEFLARCEKRGIKAHIFLPHLDPVTHQPALAQEMIRAARLDDDPAVFAYDLGWEVHVGPYAARKPHDGEWRRWVADRYGSEAAAEKDWSYAAPRTDGGLLTGPADDLLTTDGPWRVFTAAYRRFWDDNFSRGYQAVRRAVREVDPRHLMGARSGWGGLGALWTQGHLPVDLRSGAKHLDFTSPEGYNIGGDRKGFLSGGFLNAYGRYYSGGKPVYWAEFGSALFYGVSPEAYTHALLTENLQQSADYYRKTLAMVRETGADGAAGWWWPGGLRVDEKSDFGIIQPDGTPRPAAEVYQVVAPAMRRLGPAPRPDVLITVDRDKHATGFSGLYAEAAPAWVAAFLQGKSPGVRTEAAGTTSANAPRVAVGNVPATGSNPPKYLNAELNRLRIGGRDAGDGAVIDLRAGEDVALEAEMGNTAEASWLAPKGPGQEAGGVYLEATWDGGKALIPLATDTPFLADGRFKGVLPAGQAGETRVTLRLVAAGWTPFGEVVRVTLRRRAQ